MSVGRIAPHRALAEITTRHAGWPRAARAVGRVEMIVVRPERNERTSPLFAELDVHEGLVGDHWAQGRRKLAAQLSLIDVRVADAVAAQSDWPLAGDNFVVDLELSLAALRPGRVLRIGTARIVVTDEPHLGCKKFEARFGAEALAWINEPAQREAHRRGIHAHVLEPGLVHVGDVIAAE